MAAIGYLFYAGASTASTVIFPVRAADRGDSSRDSKTAPEQKVPRDRITLSGEATGETTEEEEGRATESEPAEPGTAGLDEEQKAELREMQSRDAHVRSHEAAHQAAGGGLAGAASFTFQTGPDGRQYAVGGEVSIKLKKGRTPEETIANARQVRAAAMAPSDPSSQDMAVAAAASQMEMAAHAQKARAATAAYQSAGGSNAANVYVPEGGSESLSAFARA